MTRPVSTVVPASQEDIEAFESLLASQQSLIGDDDQGEPFYSFEQVDETGVLPEGEPQTTSQQIDDIVQSVTQERGQPRQQQPSGSEAGSVRHANQLARLARRALLENDTEARARLEASPAGRTIIGLVDDVRSSSGRQAGESYAKGIRWYEDKRRLYETNRAEFDRTVMADPNAQQRYAQWGAVAQKLERGEPVFPQPQARGVSSLLAKTYDRLVELPGAKALDDAALAALEPENFADLEPDEAVVQMTETYRRLVEQPARRAAAAPVRQRMEQVRGAAPQSVREQFSQGPAPARMPMSQSGGIDKEQIRQAYRRNPGDPKARMLYDKYIRRDLYGSDYRR
jgi:hypothetical protein